MDRLARTTTAAMQGDGYYNRHSAMQANGIARVLPVWEKVAHSVPVGDETIVIADYGSSQGRNSMAPMRVAINALRAKSSPDRVVEVMHTDLPSNDFASLFQALADDPESYCRGVANVFPRAIGRSYFEPIIAPGTVHLGWNSWTLQWMSRNPADVSDHVLAGLSADSAAEAAVIAQAAEDWRDFIAARASELRRGALLFCLFAASHAGRRTWAWLFDQLWGAAQEMGKEGLLSAQELERMTLPLFGRTIEDIRAPFEPDGAFAGMALEHAEVIASPDPFWAEFQKTGDAEELGRSWAGIWRAVAAPTLSGALHAGRDAEATLDGLFSRFARRVAAEPREQANAVALAMLRKL